MYTPISPSWRAHPLVTVLCRSIMCHIGYRFIKGVEYPNTKVTAVKETKNHGLGARPIGKTREGGAPCPAKSTSVQPSRRPTISPARSKAFMPSRLFSPLPVPLLALPRSPTLRDVRDEGTEPGPEPDPSVPPEEALDVYLMSEGGDL